MVRVHKVIVNGLRNADEPDVTSILRCIAGKLAYSIHGIISADVEEIPDAVLFQPAEQFWIHPVVQVFRQLVPAGAQIGTGRRFDELQLPGALQRLHIHHFPV